MKNVRPYALELDDTSLRQESKTYYIAEIVKIDVSDPEANKNILISGTSGGGKTISILVVADQNDAGIYIDNKGGGWKKIEKFGFEGWEYFDTDKNKIQLNICDLQMSALKVLQINNSSREQILISTLVSFCSLPKRYKTFEMLKQRLANIREMDFANELAIIFSSKDKGISLGELVKKKICWNIRPIGMFHRSTGLLVKLLYDYIYAHPLEGTYFLSVDDAQSAATLKTTLGKAFASSFSEGREFGIVNIMGCTHDSEIAYGVKTNCFVRFYFKNDKKKDEYVRDNMDFEAPEMRELMFQNQKGNFFLKTDADVFVNGRRTTLDMPFPVHLDLEGYLKYARKKRHKTTMPEIAEESFF